MKCDCGSFVKMNTTVNREPHGEVFTDKWFQCPACDTVWTEDELLAIQD